MLKKLPNDQVNLNQSHLLSRFLKGNSKTVCHMGYRIMSKLLLSLSDESCITKLFESVNICGKRLKTVSLL